MEFLKTVEPEQTKHWRCSISIWHWMWVASKGPSL